MANIYTELARFEVDTKEVQVHTEEYNFTCYNSEGRTKFASEFMCHTHTHTQLPFKIDVTPCSTMGAVGAQPATSLYGITVMFIDTIRRTSNPGPVQFLPRINIMLCNFFYLPGCDCEHFPTEWKFPPTSSLLFNLGSSLLNISTKFSKDSPTWRY